MSWLVPAPQNTTLVWRPEIRVRGSYNILSSCLIILISCAWTAVHLNVPKHEKAIHPHGAMDLQEKIVSWLKKKKHLWRKIAWGVLSLLTPELIAFTAWAQHVQASKLYKDICKIRGFPLPRPWYQRICGGRNRDIDEEMAGEPDAFEENEHWQGLHAYYATMGGFAFDPSISAGYPFKGRSTATPSGLRFLAKYAPECIPLVSTADIEDKSKADSFGKFLVCTQAVWFCLQCITRIGQKMSISLLELLTLGHAICALFVYTQWWTKPLNIMEPSLIKGDLACQIWCLLHLTNSCDLGQGRPNLGRGFNNENFREERVKLEVQDLVENGRQEGAPQEDGPQENAPQEDLAQEDVPQDAAQAEAQAEAVQDEEFPDNVLQQVVPQDVPQGHLQGPRDFSVVDSRSFLISKVHRCIFFPKFDALRLKSALNASRNEARLQNRADGVPPAPNVTRLRVGHSLHKFTLKSVPSKLCPGVGRDEDRYLDLKAADIHCWELASIAITHCQEVDKLASLKNICRYKCIQPRVKNWPSEREEIFVDSGGLPFELLSLGIASALFGGLLLIPWNGFFASRAEMLLWRISALAISLIGPVLLVENFLALIAVYRNDTGSIFLYLVCKAVHLFLIVTSVLYAALYTFARVYIIVACFINLLHLSDSAFLVPVWSQYFPHVT